MSAKIGSWKPRAIAFPERATKVSRSEYQPSRPVSTTTA